ncbi:hypothetical protein ACN265_26155 [Micromonospora sp. WMMD730]|uniref:hypothetical protein n=1 Tax=Micromonospora sp. WMMD730 TaxID=3404128 RepID=UPI003B92D022
MDEDHAYRAMDLPIDTDSRVQEVVYFAVAAPLDLEVDLRFLVTRPEYGRCHDHRRPRRWCSRRVGRR